MVKSRSKWALVLGVVAAIAFVVGALNAQRWLLYHPKKADELNAQAKQLSAQLAELEFDDSGAAVDRESYRDTMFGIESITSRLETNRTLADARRNYTLASLAVLVLATGLAFRLSRDGGSLSEPV